MKRFLLYLSALFLSVSFANAQELEYVISPSTGTIVNVSGYTVTGTSRGCTWTSNNDSPTLTVNVTSEGSPVNKMYVMSNNKKHSLDANYNNKAVSYTVSVPEDCGYIITGYSLGFSTYKTVTITNEIDNYNETLDGIGEMSAIGLNICSFTFTLSSSDSNGAIDVNENGFVVFLEQESSVPAEEYTVSVIAGEGGTATVNGAAEAKTTGKATLVAVPNYGYKFVNWTVGTEEVSTSAEYTATVDSDTEFVANFAKFENTDEWYAAIEKPTFGKTGNTTFITSATVDGVAVENIPEYIADDKAEGVARQSGVTTAIEVTPGAQLNLNITYQLNWGDLAIYQIDNDGATKEYGYYFGSWTATDPNTGTVIENIANDDISVSDIVDGVCTVTYPISINENHNVGDVIVVRAITGVTNNATNSAFEKGIAEGGYVDFLFVVAEEEEPAFSHTLTVTEDGWATLYLGATARIPSDVEAYTVTAVNDGWVSLTPVTGVIPENTGIIVKADAADYKFFMGETATADVTGNLLSGSAYNKNIGEEAYVLGKVDGVVGLYKAEMNQMDGTAWLNNANKAYLPASAVSNKSAAFFGFDWDGTTGVDQITDNREQSTAIYDLTGRSVEAITAPGIYVVNGKKLLVK